MLKGKFDYISPEQVHGRKADCRSDIFAAGILLHEMLTGRRLFKGKSDLETLENVTSRPIPPPSAMNRDVPARLDEIVLRALQRNPDDRYSAPARCRRTSRTS